MKKVLIVLMSLMLFALTGCGDKDYEIPLIIYDFEDLYMQDFEDLIYLADNYSEFHFVSYDSKNSQIIQNEIVSDVLLNDSNVIVVNPVDRLGVYPIIAKAKENDISIIFINREPIKEDLLLYDKLYYVGAKPEQSAEYQADIIIDLFGGNPYALNEFDLNEDNVIQCVILKGEPGHQDAEIRTENVIEELHNAGFEVEILTVEEAYFSQDLASQKMRDLLPLYGESMEIVIANNDAMAIGAINVLIEEGFFVDENLDESIDRETETWFPVVGIDGLPIAVELIEKGYLYGTVLNDSETMAQAINELAYLLVSGLDINDFSFVIEDNKYIWIDYKKIY
ncbi:MAG: galactose ABC transporter substrate-binding protein [Candidatus Izemoplasmatales bacterium]|nr:galactose ABC transporter substrate-binding protein [Candidatus Izemoplasmatales bacterium]